MSTQMQVEVESAELQPPVDAVTANPEAMLDLEPQHVVGAEDEGLGQPLAEPPLEADEGTGVGGGTCRPVRAVLQPSGSLWPRGGPVPA